MGQDPPYIGDFVSIDIQDTILIVVGAELVPEEKDRPLAYDLKKIIDIHGNSPYQRAVVVSDRWYLDNEMFHICPTILIGGPGVNAVTANTYKEMPVLWTDQQNIFLQIKNNTNVALWGMDQAGTEQAIQKFIQDDYLNDWLKSNWRNTS